MSGSLPDMPPELIGGSLGSNVSTKGGFFAVQFDTKRTRPAQPVLPRLVRGSHFPQAVLRGRAAMTLHCRKSGTKFEFPPLLGNQRRPGPREVFLSAKDMPDDAGELASGCNSGNLVASLRANTQEAGTQRPRGLRYMRRRISSSDHSACATK